MLRAAKSAEDTSVAAFLQQLYKDDIAREEQPLDPTDSSPKETLSADDDFGVGDTAARPKTITATPVGPNPARTHTTPSKRPRGAMDDDEGPAKRTEEFDHLGDETLPPDGKVKPQTEQMPAIKRPTMRRFDPIPIEEPSVLVRPSAALPPPPSAPGRERVESPEPSAPSLTETAGADDVPLTVPGKSNTPLMVVLGILVVGLIGGGAVVAFGPKTDVEAPPVAQPEPVVTPPVAKNDPPVEAAKPDAAALAEAPDQEKDASIETSAPVAVAVVIDAGVQTARLPPVIAKKAMGSLVVKAIPFANVTIQGKSYEVMGTRTLAAPVGTYEIVLKHPRKTSKEKVTVPASGAATVSFSAE
ncbi:MAG: hypothetical protein QM817_02140 [Archangium sp.]